MNKSFTLIEILVVIVVIGVLSAFILVGMSSITSSANIAKGKAFLNSMDNSLLLGRVSQWKFDEAVGSVTTNDSWGTNTGTLSGTAPLAQFQTSGCVSNNCLSFDGSDDYVNITEQNNSLDCINAVSVSAWIYQSGSHKGGFGVIFGGRLLGGGDSYELFFQGADIKFAVDTGSSKSVIKTIVPLNEWHNVVGNWDGSYLSIYYDGFFVESTSQTGAMTSSSTWRLGGPSSTYNFNGKIDEVRVYNQAIPASEIQQSYFVGINKLYNSNNVSKQEYIVKIKELLTQNP